MTLDRKRLRGSAQAGHDGSAGAQLHGNAVTGALTMLKILPLRENTGLAHTALRRATSATRVPLIKISSMFRALSSSDHRRRRSPLRSSTGIDLTTLRIALSS